MNERIRKLAEQAAKWAQQAQWSTDSRFGDRPFSDLYDEKFAELIVKECADISDKIYFDNYPDAEDFERSEEGEAIKKHFGVE